ncbi:hypothetical protein [Negadavirga shengliensis]|uniref:Beta-hexosaminidase bacterial type N-terminal domain-containing protein n=1 Tax=Negadavirga shengliensis TaxID=1389218 RepID=A0ABV9T514_9BACT
MRTYVLAAIMGMMLVSCDSRERISMLVLGDNVRVLFGADKLLSELKQAGHPVQRISSIDDHKAGRIIVLGTLANEKHGAVAEQLGLTLPYTEGLSEEGFGISSNGEAVLVSGVGESGTLYGAMELVDRLKAGGRLDFSLEMTDQPKMVLRGAAIGLQKTEYLPGRRVYEYPYTPENFPWFYDKELWIDYLDMLVENRMNSLYLWNGHPFASLVKLDDYPYALEVDEETFRKNEDIFTFLTEEADKRGIWVIQMFYNIIVSKPFAEHHDIVTQDRSRPIVPLIADYTQKSIAAFIEKYPNVGLLVALGEAMQGEENDVRWFTETVLPGVKDGLQALGRTDEPPVILRAHDTNAPLVMEHALPVYKNLYTMHKYNGESLTTYEPGGPWTKIHQDLSSTGSIHISNVHILANLEPFRYGSPDFIQKSVRAMHEIHGANALHLYPQASYWDWPYTADKVEKRLLQLDRDWIWYKAWARYAWNEERERDEEWVYWTKQLADMYGDEEAGRYILEAYEETGEIAPKLLRRFGITEGNRQTLLLGMFGSQLVNPYKWRVYPGFYESCGPEGEILIEYAEKEWNGEPHLGETPPQIVDEVVRHGEKALAAIENAAETVRDNQEEFERLRNDVHAYKAFADFFSEKVKAAMWVLRYGHSKEVADLEKALPHLKASVSHYRDLVALTKDRYLYANSMQTAQRRIPIGGDGGKHKTWEEMLPHYERELDNFERNLALIQEAGGEAIGTAPKEPWEPVAVEWLDKPGTVMDLEAGKSLYTDAPSGILQMADELKNLKGLVLKASEQENKGTQLRFRADRPVKLVVGYFNTDERRYLMPPTLETDAAGNVRGQAEVLLANAMEINGQPRVNVHTFLFGTGEQELSLDPGKILILGFVDGEEELDSRDVGLIGEEEREAVDWVFY